MIASKYIALLSGYYILFGRFISPRSIDLALLPKMTCAPGNQSLLALTVTAVPRLLYSGQGFNQATTIMSNTWTLYSSFVAN